MNKAISRGIQIAILLTVVFYAQFHKLGKLAFRIWDESRLAANAYEMNKTGSLLVTTFDYKPDMWNTKPPLMIWMQAACIHLHGLSEVSVRLPAALCAALTIFVLFLFVLKLTGSGWAALLSAIALCTAKGYIGYHGARNGDYDSMLTLFTTCYLVFFFLFTESVGNGRNRYLFLFFISITLAVLTKSIAGLLFAPALLLYLLFRGQAISTLANKWFYIGTLLFVVFVGGYYLLREHANPGYIQTALYNEVGGRYNGKTEEHIGPWNFYWDNLKGDGFGYWFWVIPASVVIIWIIAQKKAQRIMAFCLLTAFSFLLIISISKTKLLWYDLPVFPLFAIIASVVVFQFSELLPSSGRLKKEVLLVTMIVLVSIIPLRELYNFVKWQDDDLSKGDFYAASYYFREAIQHKKNLANSVYLFDEYSMQWRLYIRKMNDMGMNIREQYIYSGNTIKAGDCVIANQDITRNFIEQNYTVAILDEFYGLKYYSIKAAKPRNN